jgi:predicted RNase H-like HicB family nuclease
MSLRSIIVKANWDPDAGVWVATSDDIPGLVAEAETAEALEAEIQSVIGDLMELNGPPEPDLPTEIPLHIMHHHISKVRIRAA